MSAKILLADDDPAVCQFVDVILKQAGYSVVRAADGVEAMERVRQSPPDLILLDILMPGRDGLDVLRSLRQNPETSQIPVIMLTQKAQVEDRVKGLEGGADDYVPKPFVPQELLVRIRALLRRSEKVRALGPLMGVLGEWFSVQGIEQLGHELETAREIQFRLLPPALPNLAGVEVGAALEPTKSVGGDFYDFIPMPGGVGFAIGDVSGKGIPGALLMVMVRSLLRATAWELDAPGEIVRRVNRFLHRDLPPSMFVTMVFGVLSLGGGRPRPNGGARGGATPGGGRGRGGGGAGPGQGREPGRSRAPDPESLGGAWPMKRAEVDGRGAMAAAETGHRKQKGREIPAGAGVCDAPGAR